MNSLTLKVHPDDTVIVALHDLFAGQEVLSEGELYKLPQNVPAKHKFSAQKFSPGDPIKMYGVKVGIARESIARGELIHMGNIVHATTEPTFASETLKWNPPAIERWKNATFKGFRRTNGKVGTANVWIVVPLVFCENRNLAFMKEALIEPLGYTLEGSYKKFGRELVTAFRSGEDLDAVPGLETSGDLICSHRLFPNVDGIRFLSHTLGCGGTMEDAASLTKLLAGYISHPNVAGATVLSLGCQKAQIEQLKSEIQLIDQGFDKPVFYFEQQKSQSEKDMLSQAIRSTFKGVAEANQVSRSSALLSELVIGVECGASDGFSGISANPVIGSVADRIVALGGSVILAEFPELCGIEQSLVDRCENPDLANRFLELMNSYKIAAEKCGSGLGENPSPGNIGEGLVTGAMKSAGAALKGGTSPVRGVLDYPEQATTRGLSLLCTPGNDVESTTAIAGAGANLIIFSTGLGTPTGNPVAPVLKVSSNSSVAQKFPDMIDFDAGPVISGITSIASHSDKLLEMVIKTASGDFLTCAQKLGQEDFIPWKRGVSL